MPSVMGCWTGRGRGSRAKMTGVQVGEVIVKTLETAVADAMCWSARSVAREVGLKYQSAVGRRGLF